MHREERVPVCRQMGGNSTVHKQGGFQCADRQRGGRWGPLRADGGGGVHCVQKRGWGSNVQTGESSSVQTGGSSTVQTNRGEFHCADRQGGIPVCRQAELTWRLLGGLAVLGLGRAQSYEPRLPLLGLGRLHIVVLLSGNDQV